MLNSRENLVNDAKKSLILTWLRHYPIERTDSTAAFATEMSTEKSYIYAAHCYPLLYTE